MSDAYSFPIDMNESEGMIYDQQLNNPDYLYDQQVLNDPEAFHLGEQQPEELDIGVMAGQILDPVNKLSDQQKEEIPIKSSSNPDNHSPPLIDEETAKKSASSPAQHSTKEEGSPELIRQAAVNNPPTSSTMPSIAIQPSSLPIKLAAVTNPSASSAALATTSNKPALASVAPPRQQEKPPMGQHSEPNIPPGIPQQQHPAQQPAIKPSVPPGSDLGTLGRIGVFGEDSFAVHNSAIPFMQIVFFCSFSIWFVLFVKRS